MKKIFLALAILASVTFAGAQDKKVESAKVAIGKALVASQDAKKSLKPATWQKLGQAYLDLYSASSGSAWLGMGMQELNMVVDEKPVATEQVALMGDQMVKYVYASHNYYFNSLGQLAIIEITVPEAEGALADALEAFEKFYSLDPKKVKETSAAIQKVSQSYNEAAYSSYSLGNAAKASELFEKAYCASVVEPYAQADTNALYNTAFIAFAAQDFDRAEKFFNVCLDKYQYGGQDGDVYAKLADIADRKGDKAASIARLEEGFAKYPQSQSILVGLINYYIGAGEGTDRLFQLLEQAKQNEPDNASLYYVEGNIHGQLGDIEAAKAAYAKCAEINPEYEFGYIGEGLMFFNKAVEVSEKAQTEMDDAKYMALVAEFEADLKACIPPFEKAFEITKDDSIKLSVAEYLKNAYFRFRTESEEFMAGYNKFNDYVTANK